MGIHTHAGHVFGVLRLIARFICLYASFVTSKGHALDEKAPFPALRVNNPYIRERINLEYLATPYKKMSELPDIIYIKTNYQTFDSYRYFALVDGKIYSKARKKMETGDEEISSDEWSLFEGGLPYREKGHAEYFQKPKKIMAITADDNQIVAISDGAKVFWKMLHGNIRYDTGWYGRRGFFPSGEFFIRDKLEEMKTIAVSIGRSEVVGEFIDPANRPIYYGEAGTGMDTLVALTKDGDRIYLSDSATPPDFNHEVCLPRRGQYRALNLSTSASTHMIIDQFGVVHTRFLDVDSLGLTPTHRYSYKWDDLPTYAKDDMRGALTPYALPAEDWYQQPRILAANKVNEKNRLSSDITIIQTGRSNESRELRVVGLQDGKLGYYYKKIFANDWEFKEAPLHLKKIDWLQINDLKMGHEAIQEFFKRSYESKDFSFFGSMEVFENGKSEVLPFKVHDFNQYCGPWHATLEKGHEKVDFLIHPVQSWETFTIYKAGELGVPHSIMGTFDFRGSRFPLGGQLKKVYQSFFKDIDAEAFQFMMWGTNKTMMGLSRENSTKKIKFALSDSTRENLLGKTLKEIVKNISLLIKEEAGYRNFIQTYIASTKKRLRDQDMSKVEVLRNNEIIVIQLDRILDEIKARKEKSLEMYSFVQVTEVASRMSGLITISKINDALRPYVEANKYEVMLNEAMRFRVHTPWILRNQHQKMSFIYKLMNKEFKDLKGDIFRFEKTL
jgi:hypothetical protein